MKSRPVITVKARPTRRQPAPCSFPPTAMVRDRRFMIAQSIVSGTVARVAIVHPGQDVQDA